MVPLVHAARRLLVLAALLALALLPAAAPPAAAGGDVTVVPYTLASTCGVREQWLARLVDGRAPGEWVPLKWEASDADLAALGLPPREVLVNERFDTPTLVLPDGERVPVDPALIAPESHGVPTLATFAGAGCFGIRPGAFTLIISGSAVSLCSLAHVYGSPGSYQISTAGHCTEKNGDRFTVVAALGNRGGAGGPVLLDFGQTARTTGDGGVGNDWALVTIYPEFQSLVTPTMCFWGGPRGAYTETGAVVDANVVQGNRIGLFVDPVDPDPTLVQDVVHYGHGLGVGAGGTPRNGVTFIWEPRALKFESVIAPGDSGSGANTADGRAAAIVTHILVPAVAGNGLAVAAGTRVTQVPASLANGQIVPYPLPLPGAP